MSHLRVCDTIHSRRVARHIARLLWLTTPARLGRSDPAAPRRFRQAPSPPNHNRPVPKVLESCRRHGTRRGQQPTQGPIRRFCTVRGRHYLVIRRPLQDPPADASSACPSVRPRCRGTAGLAFLRSTPRALNELSEIKNRHQAFILMCFLPNFGHAFSVSTRAPRSTNWRRGLGSCRLLGNRSRNTLRQRHDLQRIDINPPFSTVEISLVRFEFCLHPLV